MPNKKPESSKPWQRPTRFAFRSDKITPEKSDEREAPKPQRSRETRDDRPEYSDYRNKNRNDASKREPVRKPVDKSREEFPRPAKREDANQAPRKPANRDTKRPHNDATKSSNRPTYRDFQKAPEHRDTEPETWNEMPAERESYRPGRSSGNRDTKRPHNDASKSSNRPTYRDFQKAPEQRDAEPETWNEMPAERESYRPGRSSGNRDTKRSHNDASKSSNRPTYRDFQKAPEQRDAEPETWNEMPAERESYRPGRSSGNRDTKRPHNDAFKSSNRPTYRDFQKAPEHRDTEPETWNEMPAEHESYRPGRSSGNRKTTSWENSASKYHKNVGRDGSYYHRQVVIPLSAELLEIDERSTVLDLGCGQGIFERTIPETAEYTGVDNSPTLIRIAKKMNTARNHTFITADATQPLELKRHDFSHAALILSIQNMEDGEGAIRNAAEHLRKGGKLLIVLNHPCFRIPRQSSWETDDTSKLQYRRVNRYLSELKIPVNMSPGDPSEETVTWSFHRPISEYSKWLCQNHFTIERIDEWASDRMSHGKNAKMENRAREEFPLFMAILAVKKS